MTSREIARRRLAVQHVADPGAAGPAEVVGRLGAMQSQEFAVARWSIAQRCSTPPTEADLDRALADGVFLRTHVLRPTWHFVLPADLRWLLRLSGPRVHAVNAYYYRRFGVDDELAATTAAIVRGALAGGNRLTRTDLAAVFSTSGIEASGLRLGYILMRAELDGLVCGGGLIGRQHAYALLDEVAPDGVELSREESLAELVTRYFTGHGPATVKDFVWWSGLTAADTRLGIEAAGTRLRSEHLETPVPAAAAAVPAAAAAVPAAAVGAAPSAGTVAGAAAASGAGAGVVRTYWSGAGPERPYRESSPTAHLIQCYDEYVVGYSTDTRGVLDVSGVTGGRREGATFIHAILLDTQVVGFWRRRAGRSVVVETELLVPVDDVLRAALDAAVQRYGRFLGVPATWV